MAAPQTGPCEPWITWDAVATYCTPPDLPGDDTQQDTLEDAIISAVSRDLWVRTCRQYGLCSVERVRISPCCEHGYAFGWGQFNGWGFDTIGVGRRPFCSCGAYYYVELGKNPVDSIEAVYVDGVLMDPSTYRVDDYARLVRIDGQPWPTCSDISAAQGADRTFEVSFTWGLPIPPEGVMAAGLLACKLAKDIVESCGDPPVNAATIVREGITVTLRPPPGSALTTGVSFIDQWLDSFQCAKAGIFDPGAHRSMIRTGT